MNRLEQLKQTVIEITRYDKGIMSPKRTKEHKKNTEYVIINSKTCFHNFFIFFSSLSIAIFE